MLIKGVYGTDCFQINGSDSDASAVERFIRDKAYLEVPEENALSVPNKKNRVFDFTHPEIGHLIMKVSAPNPQYRPLRRFEMSLSLLFRDNAERAFLNAVSLMQAGIPTPVPLACWSRCQLPFQRERWLLVRHAETDVSLTVVLEDDAFPDEQRSRILQVVGKEVRNMHDVGWRHHDLAPGNILIDRLLTENPRLQFIDIDAVRRVGISCVSKKLCNQFNLRSLSRLIKKLNTNQQLDFLHGYYGAEEASRWQKTLAFWGRHGASSPTGVLRSFFSKH